MIGRRSLYGPAIGALFAMALLASPVRAQTPFFHQGLDLMHPPDSALPNEQVDPASGTLTVVATDLVLPGNAGFNLAITRVYNSSIFPDYNTGATAIEEDSWAGIGWKLHFGRILHSDSTIAGQMQIEMGDGSRHPLYHSFNNPNIWTTPEFWQYNPATHVLLLPNGRSYNFDREVTINDRLGTARYVTQISDPFHNTITFDYFDGSGPVDGIAAIHQVLSSTETRDITFTYDPTLKALASMTYRNHTWTYNQAGGGPAGYSVLAGVHPPQGPSTLYEYSGPGVTGELTVIHAPFGGTITYAYDNATRIAGPMIMTTRVVKTRTMAGHSIPVTGPWTFSYGTGTNQDTTTVVCPCGGTTSYRFNGTGTTIDAHGWLAGTLAELKTIETDGTVLETRTMTWQQSEAISPDPAPGQNGVWADDAIYRPLLAQTVVSRSNTPTTWTTAYSYNSGAGTFNDYGNAYRIDESTSETPYRWRRTTRTFQTGFTLYLAGAVASTTVEQNFASGQSDGATTSSMTYDLATGFVTSQTALGITRYFDARPDGNAANTTDALGHTTRFTYDWGHVASVQTPLLTTTYGISPEGVVTSETEGALTTTYDYDLALRLSAVHPPGTNAITYQPDDLHGAYVNVVRGTSTVTHLVDGFGREFQSYNTQGLNVSQDRDTCGRVIFTSQPYVNGGVYVGTSVAYDALGRVKQVTDAAGQHTNYAYVGAQVQRTDANGHTTIFDSLAFGDPGSGPILGVTDALGHSTTYRYDVTGALKSVSGPSSDLNRSWAINAKGLTCPAFFGPAEA